VPVTEVPPPTLALGTAAPAVPTATPVPTQVPTAVATKVPTTVPTTVPTPTAESGGQPSGPVRVVFPAGATSVTLPLDLTVDGAKVFVLNAKAGQRLTVSTALPGLSTDVVGPNGASLSAAGGSTDGNWTYRLPLKGEYVVLIQGDGRGQVTFTLP
jgi:hypothetical protein